MSGEPTCATCRRSWAIRVSQQPLATRTSIPSGCARSLETSGCTRNRLSFHEPSSTKRGKVGEIAAKAVVQLLFATAKSFTVDGLREKLREFFRQEVRAELSAVAALNNVELITALISFNWQLALVGLQLRILNGVVSLLTTEVHNKALAAQNGAIGSLGLTPSALEVLACIAFKQPISQAEIDRLFDADKRGLPSRWESSSSNSLRSA